MEIRQNNSSVETSTKSLNSICIKHTVEQEEHSNKIMDNSSDALGTTFLVKDSDIDSETKSNLTVNTTNTNEERLSNSLCVEELELSEKQSRVDNNLEKCIDYEVNFYSIINLIIIDV